MVEIIGAAGVYSKSVGIRNLEYEVIRAAGVPHSYAMRLRMNGPPDSLHRAATRGYL